MIFCAVHAAHLSQPPLCGTVRQEKEEADAAAAAALEQLDDRTAEVEALRLQVAAAEKAAKSAQAHATKDRASCAPLPPPLLT